jgi:hypothetical protein
VTPEVLRSITGKVCPVSLIRFVTGGQSPANPSVDRLLNDGTYALGNLVVFSQRVNRAKGEKTFEEVAAIAQKGAAVEGLQAVEWARLASLMYGNWCVALGDDKLIVPLAAVPPEHIFTPTSQVVQLLLMTWCGTQLGADKRAALLTALRSCSPSSDSEASFNSLTSCLQTALRSERHAPNVWLRPRIFDAFLAWFKASQHAVEALLQPSHERLQAGVDVSRIVSSWQLYR